MSRFPPIPESSKAYVALLKGVKIPCGTQPWVDFVSHIMAEIDPTGLPHLGNTSYTFISLQKGHNYENYS